MIPAPFGYTTADHLVPIPHLFPLMDFLPPILPAGTIDAPLRFFTDPFPAVLALDGVFDDTVAASPAVELSDQIESKTNEEEVDNLVDECT